MSKLTYGKVGQVYFSSEKEKKIAFDYLLDPNNHNVSFKHEDNQNQGAWAPEERIHFKEKNGIPHCLDRLMTAGNGSLYGRINCEEFVDELTDMANKGITTYTIQE